MLEYFNRRGERGFTLIPLYSPGMKFIPYDTRTLYDSFNILFPKMIENKGGHEYANRNHAHFDVIFYCTKLERVSLKYLSFIAKNTCTASAVFNNEINPFRKTTSLIALKYEQTVTGCA